jgi:hypothetical protein
MAVRKPPRCPAGDNAYRIFTMSIHDVSTCAACQANRANASAISVLTCNRSHSPVRSRRISVLGNPALRAVPAVLSLSYARYSVWFTSRTDEAPFG